MSLRGPNWPKGLRRSSGLKDEKAISIVDSREKMEDLMKNEKKLAYSHGEGYEQEDW